MLKNNKGFTLIELLVTIIILGLISTVSIVTITSYYEKSKEKANESFSKQLKNHIEDYIALRGSKHFSSQSTVEAKEKCYKDIDGVEKCDSVTLYHATSNPPTVEDIEGYTNKKIINPSNNIECTNDNINISLYRDSDYVYCFKVEAIGTTSCINASIDTCESLYK